MRKSEIHISLKWFYWLHQRQGTRLLEPHRRIHHTYTATVVTEFEAEIDSYLAAQNGLKLKSPV